jgi:hypothetical protein
MQSIVINFFYNWYIDDTKNFFNWFAGYIRSLDRTIGLVGNLQNWTSPLFGDYSYIGVVVGPIMRTIRIFFGANLYLAVTIFSMAIYLFWIILPILVIAMVYLNFLVLIKEPEPTFALGGELLNLIIR